MHPRSGLDALLTDVTCKSCPTKESKDFKRLESIVYFQSLFSVDDGLTFVKIMHAGVEILALVDTGSTTSLAGQSLFQQIPQLCSRIQAHKSQATAVCFSVFPILGILPFDFKIEDKLLHVQAWAKCIRIHKYSNTFLKVFIFVFEYFCEKCKVFVFEYISKVFAFMNTFMNTFNIFQFLLIFFTLY